MFEDDRFMIAEGNSTDCDLCLMSLCKYHIIANSSYSWWGAWLAKSKKVIAPKIGLVENVLIKARKICPLEILSLSNV